MDYSNIVNSTLTYTTSSSSNTVQFAFVVPRCRSCKHAHAQEGAPGCYTVNGASVAFVICSCKEHVPEDNLEYLEYLYKKKGSL